MLLEEALQLGFRHQLMVRFYPCIVKRVTWDLIGRPIGFVVVDEASGGGRRNRVDRMIVTGPIRHDSRISLPRLSLGTSICGSSRCCQRRATRFQSGGGRG